MEVTQQRIADELRTERERLTAYLEALPEGAWDKQTLCEGWTVRDLMAHVVGVASDVANSRLEGIGTTEQNQRQVDERSDRSPRQLLDEWTDQGKLLEDNVLAMNDDLWNTQYTDNFNVGQALQRMVEDAYIHAHDIRIPLGDEPVGGPGLISTLEVGSRDLHNRLPRLAPDVGTVSISAGDFKSTVKGSGNVDVSITGDPITLVLVSTGRIPLDQAIADGELKVAPEAPSGLADAINIYGP